MDAKKQSIHTQTMKILLQSKSKRSESLKNISDKKVIEYIHNVDPDDATDLLQSLSKKRQTIILKQLQKSLKDKVTYLLKFDPNSAAGLMNLDYVEVSANTTFSALSKKIKKHGNKTGKVPTILVIDHDLLKGEIPHHTLILANSKDKIKKYISPIPSIRYDKDDDDVMMLFEKNPHNKVIVLDDDDSIMGVIYSDDIMKLVKNIPGEQLQDFAGINDNEDVLDSAFVKVKYRYKWLILNLFTAFLAASVVSLFEQTIATFTLLAIYMPIVAGMGGNAGTQTLAIMVRGLALQKITLRSSKNVIFNEMIAGLINGFITGILVAIIAMVWNQNPLFGFIIGVSMVINLVIAGFFGGIIPLIMKKLGKDPASSATIFITTATDVFGFFVFLGLASLVL